MNPPNPDLTQEDVIWLILCRHEDDEDACKHLRSLERRSSHIQEDSEQDGHWNKLEDVGQEYRDSNQDKDDDMSQPLFSDS
jgi:hypothetical protein